MPKDILDEIEARWPLHNVEPVPSAALDIRTLIEMVRARDRVVEGCRMWRASLEKDGWSEADIYAIARPGLGKIIHALTALDTPTEQEQKR